MSYDYAKLVSKGGCSQGVLITFILFQFIPCLQTNRADKSKVLVRKQKKLVFADNTTKKAHLSQIILNKNIDNSKKITIFAA